MRERRISMGLYGDSLFRAGIFIIISVLILAVALGTVYLINSSRLKKQLENEYGKKDK